MLPRTAAIPAVVADAIAVEPLAVPAVVRLVAPVVEAAAVAAGVDVACLKGASSVDDATAADATRSVLTDRSPSVYLENQSPPRVVRDGLFLCFS